MRWFPLALTLAACQTGVVPDQFATVEAADPLTALSEAKTLGGQAKQAQAVWSSCARLSMTMADAETGAPVGFGEAWSDRKESLVVTVTCDGRPASFRPLGPDPVFILMRE